MTKHLCILVILAVFAFSSWAAGQSIRFVRANAPPGGDGVGWPTAYRFVQDAIDEANLGGIAQIHIAAGTYYPDEDEYAPFHTPNSRSEAFVFDEDTNGLQVIGGFPANGGAFPADYDPASNVVTLSGDLTQNDGPAPFDNNEENSYHIMVVLNHNPGGESGLFVRGLTVRGGNADLDDDDSQDGLFTMTGGGVLVTLDYGDLHGDDSRLELRDCTVIGNTATLCGGGVFINDRCSGVLRDTVIAENSSQGTSETVFLDKGGGGVAIVGVQLLVAGCTVRDNAALGSGHGGGIASGLVTFVGNTRFLNNRTANGFGGGIYAAHTMYNSTFSGNLAQGGMATAGRRRVQHRRREQQHPVLQPGRDLSDLQRPSRWNPDSALRSDL